MKNINIAVMISGGGTNLQALIDKIHNNEDINGHIKLVISNNKNAYGLVRAKNSGIETAVINRKQYNSILHDSDSSSQHNSGPKHDRSLQYNSVQQSSSTLQCSPALQYERDLINILKKANTDLIVLAGYLAFIPDRVIETYENRIINIHPSLIPSFCGKGFYGKKVHEAAINKGVKVSGATVHFVNKILDNGPIIIQRCVDVDFDDTAKSLQKKVLKIEHEILPLAVRFFIEDRIKVVGNRIKILSFSSKRWLIK